MKNPDKKSKTELLAVIEKLQSQLKTYESNENANASLNKSDIEQNIALKKLLEREELLAFEKEKLEITLRSIGDGVITTDNHGKIVLLNHTAEQLTGWLQDEAYGRNIDEIFVISNEKTKERIPTPIEKVLRTGEIVELANHTTLKSKSGNILIISDSAAPIRDKKGNISGVILVFRDTTHQKLAEKQLRESEEAYRTLFESADDAIFIMEKKVFTTCNRKALEVFKCGREQIIGMSPVFFSPEYQSNGKLSKDLAEEKILAALAGTPQYFEWIHKRADGTLFNAEVGLNLITMQGGAYLQALVRDITERKKAENALKQSEEQFRTTFENAPIGMCMATTEGKFIVVNHSLCHILGYKKKELEGISFSAVTHPDDIEKSKILIKQALESSERHVHSEKRYIHKNGQTIWADTSLSLIKDYEGAPKYLVVQILDITESKKADEKLKESEEKFRLLFTSTSQAVTLNEIILDENGIPCDYRIIEGNPAFENFIGLKSKDFVGKRVLEIFPNSEKRWFEIFGEVALTGKPKRLDDYSSDLNKYFDFTIYSPMKGQFAVISADITERKLEEKAKHLNESRLEALYKLNNMADRSLEELAEFALEEGVKLTGSKIGYLAFTNDDESILTMHAWSKNAMEQCNVSNVTFDFVVAKTGLWGEAIRQRKAVITNDYEAENPLKKGCPDGHVEIKKHMNVPIFDGDKIVALAGVGNKEIGYDDSDVKQLSLLMYGMWRLIQRKKSQEAIFESEERYRIIADNSNDIIAKFNNEGKIIFVSPACKTILGWETAEAIGLSIFDFLCPEDMPLLLKLQEDFKETKEIKLIKHKLKKKNGDYVWFETSAQVIFDDSDNISNVVAICRDISEKLKYEKLEQEKETAILANKAKSEFLANMSHEIRNPLGSVVGLTNSLTRSKLDEEQKEIVESLKISASNLLNLVNDILDFSKIEANKMDLQKVNFNVEQVIRHSHASLKTIAEQKSLKFTFSLEKDIPEILYGDSAKLKQIIINLASNAIKFTEKGFVNIHVTKSREENGLVYLNVDVSDSGIGIKKEDFSRLFQSFTQLDSSTSKLYAGTGIGLAIVKSYTELMKGSVSFSSEYDIGTTFTVEIPFELPKLKPVEPEKVFKEVDLSKHKLRILVAEDDGINQLYLKNFLTSQGIKVDTAFNGVQVIEKYDVNVYDVILMDGQMPRMDGLEATRIIRVKEEKKNTHTPIIAITGYAVSDDKKKFINAGMDDYITKPIDEMILMNKIRQYTKNLK